MGRWAFDGTEVIDGKIYFSGNRSEQNGSTILECYDPLIDQWQTLTPRPKLRGMICTTSLHGKYYVLGGISDRSVEIYDPDSDSWSDGVEMPEHLGYCNAVTHDGKIYVVSRKSLCL